MELIIQYLIEKGGGFGVLLAISLAWIVFREKAVLSQKASSESDSKSAPISSPPDPTDIEIGKISHNVQEIKNEVEKISAIVASHNPLLEQIFNMEKSGGNKIDKVNAHITTVENKIIDIDKNFGNSISDLTDAIESLEKNFLEISKSICMDLDERLQKVNDERISELKKLLEAYNKTVTDLIIALEKIKFLLKSKDDGE